MTELAALLKTQEQLTCQMEGLLSSRRTGRTLVHTENAHVGNNKRVTYKFFYNEMNCRGHEMRRIIRASQGVYQGSHAEGTYHCRGIKWKETTREQIGNDPESPWLLPSH